MNASAGDAIVNIFDGSLTAVDIWIIIGLFGQILFFMRFLVQWIVSEKTGKSVIPEVFWYFSLGGGTILLAYAIHRQDPVFIMGQSIGFVVYLRNIMLIWREKRANKQVDAQ